LAGIPISYCTTKEKGADEEQAPRRARRRFSTVKQAAVETAAQMRARRRTRRAFFAAHEIVNRLDARSGGMLGR
jgi:hypothetical protein